MSCNDHDDLDVAVQLRKISYTGEFLEHLNYPCPVLRASHRISKVEALSTDQEIFYRHDRAEKILPGTIILLGITLWPIGMVFAPGEGIVLRVAGHDMCYPETDIIPPASAWNENVGKHILHSGGRYDSHLILPFI